MSVAVVVLWSPFVTCFTYSHAPVFASNTNNSALILLCCGRDMQSVECHLVHLLFFAVSIWPCWLGNNGAIQPVKDGYHYFSGTWPQVMPGKKVTLKKSSVCVCVCVCSCAVCS